MAFENCVEKLKDLFNCVMAPSAEPERPSVEKPGQKLLYYPLAETKLKMPVKGKYKDNYPKGAVVHFTAGRSLKGDSDMEGSIAWGTSQGYAFFGISSTGKIYQTTPLDSYGYHAGTSSWKELGESLSSKLVGIEIACAGKCEKTLDGHYKTWFGELYSEAQIRFGNGSIAHSRGFYHKFTDAQEESLIKLLLWLKSNNPDVFQFDYVLGHDEIAPGRKTDPGYSLSMQMWELREKLKKEYQNKTV